MTDNESIADLQILVAEDAPSIQRLLNHLLVSSGADVTIVDNGQQAVDAIAENRVGPFDVVLMDMEMPVLDGYAATQQIRKLGFCQPIIALTAHASPAVQQKCRSVGCNDFATKPIGRARLVQLIESHCNGSNDRIAESVAVASADERDSKSEFAYLDVKAAMQRLSGDAEFLAEMAQTFLQFQDEYVNTVRRAVEASDAAELRRSAHGLKGALADFTSAVPYQTARALEVAGASGDLRPAQQLAERLQVQVDLLCHELQRYINSSGHSQLPAAANIRS